MELDLFKKENNMKHSTTFSTLWKCTQAVLFLTMIRETTVPSFAAESVAISGIENSSGNTVLCSIPLPEEAFNTPISVSENPFSLRRSRLDPLQYSVISRGIIAPNQGINDSILYWKTFRLWRYRQDTSRVILDVSFSRDPYSSMRKILEPCMLDAPKYIALEYDDAEPLKKVLGVGLLLPDDAKEEELKAYLPAAPNGLQREPITWINAGLLLVRDYDADRLDRLKSSKLTRVSLVPDDADDKQIVAAQTRLTNLPDDVLEVLAAPNAESVALQAFEEETKTFRLGIQKLKDKSNEIVWLPLPPKRDNISFESSFNKRFSYLKWSPDHRYLSVGIPGEGIAMWDTKTQKWLTRGKRIYFYPEASDILWLDNDRVLGFTPSVNGSTFLLGGRVSEFERSMTQIGELKGIFVHELFKLSHH